MNKTLNLYDAELMSEIEKAAPAMPLRPTSVKDKGITVAELSGIRHCGKDQAKRYLDAAVEKGKLVSMQMQLANGHISFVYFIRRPGVARGKNKHAA